MFLGLTVRNEIMIRYNILKYLIKLLKIIIGLTADFCT